VLPSSVHTGHRASGRVPARYAGRVIEFPQLVGSWQLVSATLRNRADDSVTDMFSANPKGFLLYTPDGGVSAIIESVAGSGDIAVSYAGRATLVDDVVTHHVRVGNAKYRDGTEQLRHVVLGSGGELRLSVDYPDVAGTLVWRRAVDQT
jgi:hypothetical protein